MQGGVLELTRQAAAAARAERGARGARAAARVAVRRYRGVMKRDGWYVAETMDDEGLRPLYLGSYATPEEAAYAYDAAARILHGDKAKPNFPETPAPPAAGGGNDAPTARAWRLPLLGHARIRLSLDGQQPAPPQAPAAPVGSEGEAQRQALSVQQAPAPHFGALPGPSLCGASPAFSEFLYGPSAGPAFDAAGGSNGAGIYAAGPALAAAGGSNGAGFYDMADMIGPEPEVPWPFPTYAASSALSTTDKANKAVVDASAAAEPKMVLFLIIDSDGEPVVEDNFPDGHVGASTSSAARPAVPPLRLKDLMESDVVRRSADEGAP